MAQMGKYQLIRRLGRGGMAEVYLAKAAGPMGFAKTLVVKRILPHLMEEQQFIEMFLSEARLAAQFNHANVVQIFDFGEEDGSYFIAMEYIDGLSLHALIKHARAEGTSFAFPLCAKILSFSCEGLAYVHELIDPETGKPLGLIHRDISPDNILVSRTGGVKVVDFGIAKVANQKHRTQTGIVKGKVAYMSPEHLRGKPLDPRADIFALGVVLYKLVTGAQPFEGESDVTLLQAILNEPMVPVSEHRKDVPPELVRIIEKALAKERDQRYGSCREFQSDLERFLLHSGEPVGPAQIAEVVKRLAPPEQISGSVPAVVTPSAPQASVEPPATAAPVKTEVWTPVSQALPSTREESRATQATGVSASPRKYLGWVAGVVVLAVLAGAGGYLGLRGTSKPEQQGGAGPVESGIHQPPPAEMPQAAREAPPPPAKDVANAVPSAQETPREASTVPTAPVAQESTPAVEKPPAPAPSPQEAAPALASFRVVSKPSGMVMINGKRVGRSPVEIEVKPGKVNVTVEGDDDGERFETSQTVLVKPGANPLVSLAPKRLKITVRGRPRDFKVQSLDIHFLGGSAGPLEVYEGWHTLKLTDPAGKSHTTKCQARAGDDLCLFNLEDGGR